MSEVKYLIGVDFGSDSARALVVNADTGEEMASEVSFYRRWSQGLYSDAAQNQFRHHPLDYLESLEECITGALKKLPPEVAANVIGIGVDTTGSTPVAVDENGTPLALLDEFRENPNAMFILWKDHTAVREAAEINNLARTWGGVDYTKYEGGVYSSEWFWAKILHILRVDEKVRAAAYSWVEVCDWIPAVLTGTTDPKVLKRSRCAAGHKAMWHPEWGGLPSEEFLTKLDPLLEGLRDRLFTETYTSDEKAGELTEEWAQRLGLPAGTAVAVGAFDAHMGAVGGGIREHALVKIMGTSTCDVMVVSKDQLGDSLVAGICGQVDGSVIPGMVGLEAGQSAFGDVYAWLRDVLLWSWEALGEEVGLSKETLAKIRSKILVKLTEEAAKVDPSTTTVVALDWLNGRRTPYADQELKGALVGLTLGTDAPRLFRALVEATAFGSKAIVDRFREEGVEIREVIAQGGIPGKNEFVMQVSADVLGMPIKVVRSDQAVALGAAMFGAVAAGKYSDVFEAQDAMLSGYSKVYNPDPESSRRYQELYEKYLQIGELLADTLRAL
ncbi:MAG: ribulokinase [Limnochordia bacterium]|jgi:L-ribulokinase|nr:ribulokinase [Bacillota bacterium]NLL09093.1 ribulokinase [Bacillota bacterium]HBG10014.1 ribulokinase [Bacillota bacterium]